MVVLLTVSGEIGAHRTNLASADITVEDGHVRFGLQVSAHDIAVVTGIDTDFVSPIPQAAFQRRIDVIERYWRSRVVVETDVGPCTGSAFSLDYSGLPDNVSSVVDFTCPAGFTEVSIGYGFFFEVDSAHRCLGRIALLGKQEEFVFDRSFNQLTWVLDRSASGVSLGQRFVRLVWLGITHILSGIDHVLFLIALVLGVKRFWDVVKIVTAFTLAHSLTLALAWMGLITPPMRLVEVMIALSIVYVAIENVLGRTAKYRWLVAGAFGLVHGLGFYGALRELDSGAGMLTILLAFNLGVEAGQLLILLAIALPLSWWWRQQWHRQSARLGSLAIAFLAGWWVVERAIGAEP